MLEQIGQKVDVPRPHIDRVPPKIETITEQFLGNKIIHGHNAEVQRAIDEGRDTYTQYERRLATDEIFIQKLQDMGVEDAIALAYNNILGRKPDEEGFKSYLERKKQGGLTFRALVTELAKSNEGSTRYVTEIYREMLGRDPNPTELETHITLAQKSGPHEGLNEVAVELRGSDEFYRLTKAKRRECALKKDKTEELKWRDKELSSIDLQMMRLYDDFYRKQPDIHALVDLHKMEEEIVQDKLTISEVRHIFAKNPDYIKRQQALRSLYYGDHESTQINFLYEALLGRSADPAGLKNYSEQLKQGKDIGEIIRDIVQSDEYRRREIKGLYQELLLREPDEEGLKAYSEQLIGDKRSITSIAMEIQSSSEGKEVAAQSYINKDGFRVVIQPGLADIAATMVNPR